MRAGAVVVEATFAGSFDVLLVSQGVNEFCHKLIDTQEIMNHIINNTTKLCSADDTTISVDCTSIP
jgi:hypothetical protein